MPHSKNINLSRLNGHLICGLCGGYLIDATVLSNCIHAFCRSCILKYIAELNNVCPLCQTLIQEGRATSGLALRPDVTLQRVVYKLVPGLLNVEIGQIAEFHKRYLKNPGTVIREVRLSCKESRILSDISSSETALHGLSSPVPTPLATRSLSRGATSPAQSLKRRPIKLFPQAISISCLIDSTASVSLSLSPLFTPPSSDSSSLSLDNFYAPMYLLCPASCTIAHLQRFLLAKHYNHSFPSSWTVDIFLRCEYLEPAHSLRELAFLYAWPTQHRVLPLLYRFSDNRRVWWGAPLLYQDPPSTSTTPPIKKRRRLTM